MWVLGDWQRSKSLLEPLLEDSDAAVGVGQIWRGSKVRNPVHDLEKGFETAVTAENNFNGDTKFNGRKEVLAAGDVSKVRTATSNLYPRSEFLFPRCLTPSYFTSCEVHR